MSSKAILILCAQALLVQSVFSQRPSRAAIDASGLGISAPYGLGPALSPALAAPGLAARGLCAPATEFTVTSGGALPVTSCSAIAPTGITIVSENVFEGPLNLAGELPFMGTTGMEGAMPTAGAGAINYACGNGVTAMASNSVAHGPGAVIPPIAATFGPAASIAPVAATFAQAPLAGRVGLVGCGRDIIN